jgi:hypothetical protein
LVVKEKLVDWIKLPAGQVLNVLAVMRESFLTPGRDMALVSPPAYHLR